MAETKTYPYVILLPLENAIDYRVLGEYPGRAPEQAVEAAVEAGVIAPTEGEGGLTVGVIAVPASKWYVVEGNGQRRIDWTFGRSAEVEAEGDEPPAEPQAPPPPPPEALANATIGAGGAADPSLKQL